MACDNCCFCQCGFPRTDFARNMAASSATKWTAVIAQDTQPRPRAPPRRRSSTCRGRSQTTRATSSRSSQGCEARESRPKHEREGDGESVRYSTSGLGLSTEAAGSGGELGSAKASVHSGTFFRGFWCGATKRAEMWTKYPRRGAGICLKLHLLVLYYCQRDLRMLPRNFSTLR